MRVYRFVLLVSLSVLILLLALARAPILASAPRKQQNTVSVGRSLPMAGIPSLHAIADSARNTDLRWPGFATYKPEVIKFYDANGYTLAWQQNGQVRPQALAVIDVLEHAIDPTLSQHHAAVVSWRCCENRERSIVIGAKPRSTTVSNFISSASSFVRGS